MTKDELLRPRYKVINKYPRMEIENLKVGDVFTMPNYDDESTKKLWCAWNDDYPAIFKRLEWWQDRDEKDMPEYVKLVNGKICRVTQYFNFNALEILLDGKTRNTHLRNCLPATEEEYINQPK